jgi:hypothetical protein
LIYASLDSLLMITQSPLRETGSEFFAQSSMLFAHSLANADCSTTGSGDGGIYWTFRQLLAVL